MKNIRFFFCALAALSAVSCDFNLGRESAKSSLLISFDGASVRSALKSVEAVPDTNDFILTVRDSKDKMVYEGKFGDSPLRLSVDAGTYTVSAVSVLFDEPLFETPQWGDEQLVVVPAGAAVSVRLDCRQTNCGVRIVTKPGFRTRFPSGVLYLNSSDGRLMYGYAENRTAYFKPGPVSLELVNDGSCETLLTRTLTAAQMLSLSIDASYDPALQEGIHIQVDTARVWTDEEYEYGGHGEGEDIDTALSVQQAKDRIGSRDVWVYGYIVGISTSSTKSEYCAPFSLNTNILLASRSVVGDRGECISVELPKGDVRDALNLKDNPENLGRQVLVRGNMVDSYYGLPGLKSATDFAWK